MLRWSSCWITSFVEDRHVDGRRGTVLVARIVAMRKIASVPVMAHPSGRERRLYLTLANRGRGWEAVGVFGTAKKAKHEAERSLGEVAE
jgi:hypothetical protein